MTLRSLIAAFFSRGSIVLVFWLITIITCVRVMYKSSFVVGASALVACALCYWGASAFMGSLLARREKSYIEWLTLQASVPLRLLSSLPGPP